jgi:hypothetical protein
MVGKLSALREIDPSRYVVYIGFFIILVAFSIVLHDDGFLTTRNLLNIVQQTAPVTVMAVGMVFVLTAGEIDLSIGSIVAISALLAAVVLRTEAWFIGAAAGLAAGALIGAATNAYAAPSYGYAPAYSYGYAPASYGYAQTAYYDDDYVAAPVYRTRVVRRAHYAPVYRQRIVRAHYAPAYRTRAVRAHYAPAYGARVVRGYGHARAHGYTRASHWGGQRVSYSRGSRGHWR